MSYEVKAKFVFSGTFIIEADSPAQAKEFIHKHCGLALGRNIHTTLSEGTCGWNFDMHPEKIIGTARKVKARRNDEQS